MITTEDVMQDARHDTMTEDGYQAYYDGYELHENPELDDTDAWHAWVAGWKAARTRCELRTGGNHDAGR